MRWDGFQDVTSQFLTNQMAKNRSHDVPKTMPSHLAGPAHLHMNSPYAIEISPVKTKIFFVIFHGQILL